MSEPWDKGKKVELPNPELNPLQNPTLGKNLGRWAQVYFTSPPEKREQAVVDLLRELESETEPRPPRLEETLPSVDPVIPRLICKNCQQPNELDQRFCGLCGSPLRSADSPVPETPRRVVPTAEVRPEPAAAFTSQPETTEDNDLQWLREKSLSRLSDPDDEPSGKWKYILIAVVLVAAGFGTLQWMANRPATTAPAPATTNNPVQTTRSAPPVTPPVSPATSAVAPSEPAVAKKPRVEPSVATSDAMRSARVLGTPQNLPPAAPPASASAEGGTQELNLAQGYLEGKHGSRDSTEAAKWLWKAVAKQNSTADVLLANLYISGDGVSKSCAQARLLLTAAAQKGEPTAGERLRQLDSTCR